MKPHKHADLIKQWADGAEIQYYAGGTWYSTPNASTPGGPSWCVDTEYRVKPAPKPNVVTWHAVFCNNISGSYSAKSSVIGSGHTALRLEIDHNDPANPVLVSATLEKP